MNVKIKGNNLSVCFFDIKRINDCEAVLLKYDKPSILLKFEAFMIMHSLKDIKSSDGSADFKSRQLIHPYKTPLAERILTKTQILVLFGAVQVHQISNARILLERI